MKKHTVIALVLALCLALTGCMNGGMIAPPETLSDGTPWDGKWVNMAGLVGVEKPQGFDLLTTNGTLEDMSIQYATWVQGRETEIDKNTYIYEGQIYLMTELCESADQAAAAVQEWYGQFGETLEITARETAAVDGVDYELLYYTPKGADTHFTRGVCTIWQYGSMVLVADIACADTLELDLTKTMTEFLRGFHYV